MQSVIPFSALALFVAVAVPLTSFAENGATCAVTTAPDRPFIPPPPWDPYTARDGRFLFGAPGLWTIVKNHWALRGLDGIKLPYFSAHYNLKAEHDPRMFVVAPRLDAAAHLVWADWVNGAGPSFRPPGRPDPTKPGFMVTSLQIPTAGCWEITARYAAARDTVETLSYTVLVER